MASQESWQLDMSVESSGYSNDGCFPAETLAKDSQEWVSGNKEGKTTLCKSSGLEGVKVDVREKSCRRRD